MCCVQVLNISGRALRPLCHFELPPSDYLERRPAGLPDLSSQIGAVDSSLRVIEFQSLGVRVKNTFRFGVVNPTNASYEFGWEVVGTPNPCFRCGSSAGIILGGKRQEMVFEFTPATTEPAEAYYRFSIPSQSITAVFLVAGVVVEPKVSLGPHVRVPVCVLLGVVCCFLWVARCLRRYMLPLSPFGQVMLDPPRVNFRELLFMSRATEIIHVVNREHIPFAFAFDVSQIPGSEDGRRSLKLSPEEGVVPPNGSLAIEVVFCPLEEKAYNFNVPCIVKKKPSPLSLNVKGEGYAVHDSVVLESDGGVTVGAKAVPLSSDGLNHVDFGHVHVNEKAVRNIVFSNTGKVNYDFVWTVESTGTVTGAGGGKASAAVRASAPVVVSPQSGKVHMNSQFSCQLEFRPVDALHVEGLVLCCTVAGTRTYRVSVSGRGARPALEFSATDIDLGPCFFPSNPGVTPVPETYMLRITNNEREDDVSLECLFEKKAHLEVGFDAMVLRPGQSVAVPLLFMPRGAGPVSEVIPFEVNGLYRTAVNFAGEGTPVRVLLANPAQASLAFGSLRVGQEAVRRVAIVNRSKRTAAFVLQDVVKDTTTGKGALETCFVSFSPKSGSLRPKETTVIEVRVCVAIRSATNGLVMARVARRCFLSPPPALRHSLCAGWLGLYWLTFCIADQVFAARASTCLC